MSSARLARAKRALLAAVPVALACGRTDLDGLAVAPGQSAAGSAGSAGADAASGLGGDGVGAASGSAGATGAGPGATGGGAGTADAAPGLPKLIAAEAYSDVVHDARRRLLYISTRDGRVLRYDLVRLEFREPIAVGGVLLGIDLSFDESTLAVADETFMKGQGSTNARNWVHVIELDSGRVKKIEFSDQFYEAGTYMPVFLDDNTLLVSSSYPGTGIVPLRRVNLIDGSYDHVVDVNQDTALVRSADRSTVAYAESNDSGGPFGYYAVASGFIAKSGTEWFNYTIGVSGDGEQFSVPVYAGMFVYNRALQRLTTFGTYADEYPSGVVYSPTSDVMYLSWIDSKGKHPAVEAYDTHSFARLTIVESQNRLSSTNFAPGKMRISRDGRHLFVLVYEGVRVYDVEP